MDRLNRSAKAARTEFAELIADGLVLWCLSTAGQANVWCMVFEHPGSFCLVLDSDPEGTEPYKICEEHPDIVRLVHRADTLKSSLLECGWSDIDGV
jgi:hypothetical protein